VENIGCFSFHYFIRFVVRCQSLLAGIEKYGTTKDEICKHTIGLSSEQINEKVIIAPWWEPTSLPALGKAAPQTLYSARIKVWLIENGEEKYTYIKTGIGAPVLIDVVLALGLTKCKSIIFVGSVGSLSEEIGIGDIVIPEFSVCGDGASRYIKRTALMNNDVWGEKAYPNKSFLDRTKKVTAEICEQNNIAWHKGYNFSADSIFAQFAHIDEIIGLGCNVIEMETAAAFEAASMAGIPIAALFSVSDNTVINKPLPMGLTEKEQEYRIFVRKTIFPQIISRLFV
jgi:Uridine phosphorylase